MLPKDKGPHDDDDMPDMKTLRKLLTLACERLDTLVGGNTLFAFMDGTIHEKLFASMLTDEDWELLGMTHFISVEMLSEDRDYAFMRLLFSLDGLIQFFHYCDIEITDDWSRDINNLGFSRKMLELPPDAHGLVAALSATDMGMTSEQVFALVEYSCLGEIGTMH